ncbi:MAG: NADH-quinone oxidoreductase subunit L [Actinomycetota bacterium]|nr:NADH-quinone oxidoreductase subunit L [Actinomycetota bacterium]
MSATTWAWIALACPLAGTVLIALAWRALRGRSAGWLGTLSILGSFGASIACLLELRRLPQDEQELTSSLFDYARTAGVHADLGILVDPLAVFMLLVVSGVSSLIHLYSISYMETDRGYARYFSYLNYFVFSMLLLTLAGNFVLLIVGWAFVGAASYLLISFWYRRGTATQAGLKAFVMNVIGDVGLVIAAFLLFDKTGALDYEGVFAGAHRVFSPDDPTLVAACLMLLVGAFAKSGQIPLHTWLPDAMEGPTPVSALIHAATMVTAGVYLVARMFPLFELAPTAALVGAIVATVTLFFAATVALAITDLKRIIAYSTISQIGYMMLGVTAFAYGAGLFHLMTHAFFKALLFMAAGSVIGAMSGLQDIDRMGGFRRAMPLTFATFTAGALALAGFPLFSGFFSKDEVLSFALHRGGTYAVLAVVGYVSALLTAVYAFRMVFRVFFGRPVPEAASLIERGEPTHHEPQNPATGEPEDGDVGFEGPEHTIAERAWPMRLSMVPLALLAVVGGIVGVPALTDTLEKFLEPTFQDSRYHVSTPSANAEWAGLAVGGGLAVAGIAVAFLLWMRGATAIPRALRERLPAAHDFLFRRWYFDELYDRLFVRPAFGFGRFGRSVIESAFVQGTIVGGASGAVRAGTSFARAIQSGYLRAYALLLLIGVSGLGFYFLLVAS